MTPRQILNAIRDELDSRQIIVKLQETPFGVIVSGDYPSCLIAKASLRRMGIVIREPQHQTPQQPHEHEEQQAACEWPVGRRSATGERREHAKDRPKEYQNPKE